MEWEVRLIEWIQKTLGSLNGSVGTVLSFIGGEMGLLMVLLIILFCWKKETGKRMALIITAVNAWLPMLKAAVMRPRPYMEYPDRVRGIADAGNKAPMDNVAAHGYSFPSTHSASAMALFIPLANEVKKKWFWIAAVAITFLVGLLMAFGTEWGQALSDGYSGRMGSGPDWGRNLSAAGKESEKQLDPSSDSAGFRSARSVFRPDGGLLYRPGHADRADRRDSF